MAFGTRAQFEAVREVAAASVGATYSAVGTAIVDHARLIRIVSTLNAEVYVSFDGIVDHIRMAVGSFFIMDLSSNKVRDDGMFVSVGTVFYVKQVSGAAATGSLWIEVLYAAGGV